MNRSQNFINKVFLLKTLYPQDKEESWYIPQAEINRLLADGKLPEVVLPEMEENGRPKIAVLLNRERHPERPLRDYSMPQRYVDAVMLSGGYPVFIYYENVKAQLEKICPDGILLTGGDFAFPAEWTEGTSAHNEDLQRFQAYVTCFEYAEKNKLPLLGICAGMQVMAGCLGGKIMRVSGHRGFVNDYAHTMDIIPESLLAQIAGRKSIKVNSNHSEAVNPETAGFFHITALAPDGVVEAIEPAKPWGKFVLGIQSHPEAFVKKGDDFAKRLFNSFVGACLK